MKNLAKHKDKVNARELLIQAMYEFSFGHNKSSEIEKSFLKDFTKTKVDYIFFRNVFSHATKNFEKIKSVISEKSELNLFGIKKIGLGLASIHMNATAFYVMIILTIFGGTWNNYQLFGAIIVGIGVYISQSSKKSFIN